MYCSAYTGASWRCGNASIPSSCTSKLGRLTLQEAASCLEALRPFYTNCGYSGCCTFKIEAAQKVYCTQNNANVLELAPIVAQAIVVPAGGPRLSLADHPPWSASEHEQCRNWPSYTCMNDLHASCKSRNRSEFFARHLHCPRVIRRHACNQKNAASADCCRHRQCLNPSNKGRRGHAPGTACPCVLRAYLLGVC